MNTIILEGNSRMIMPSYCKLFHYKQVVFFNLNGEKWRQYFLNHDGSIYRLNLFHMSPELIR